MVLDSPVQTVQAVLGRLQLQASGLGASAPLLGGRVDADFYAADGGDEAYARATDGDYLDGPSDTPDDPEQRVRVAVSFVRDAIHGRNPNRRTTRRALRAYDLYHSRLGQMLRYASTVAYILIPLYEEPGWCSNAGADCESDAAARYWWFSSVWPRTISSSAELLCLSVVGLELYARLQFTGWREFRREWWTVSRALVAAASAADVAAEAIPWIAWRRTAATRVLRIFVFLTQHHSLRVACMSILRTVPALTEVLLILSGVILLSAWAATLLFAHSASADFKTFAASLVEMYTLLTVTNFPSVTLGQFRESRASFLFFVAFLFAAVLLLLNLTLAIVYEAYRINLGREVGMQLGRQRRALRRAFDTLAVPLPPDAHLYAPAYHLAPPPELEPAAESGGARRWRRASDGPSGDRESPRAVERCGAAPTTSLSVPQAMAAGGGAVGAGAGCGVTSGSLRARSPASRASPRRLRSTADEPRARSDRAGLAGGGEPQSLRRPSDAGAPPARAAAAAVRGEGLSRTGSVTSLFSLQAGGGGGGGGGGSERGASRAQSAGSLHGLLSAEGGSRTPGRSPPPRTLAEPEPAPSGPPRGVRLDVWCAALRRLSPALRGWQAEMLFHGCDAVGSGALDVTSFNAILLALQLRFEPVRPDTRPLPAAAGAREARCGGGRCRRAAHALLRDPRTERLFDGLAGVTAVAVAWPDRDVALVLHLALVALFALEMLAKLALLGVGAYVRSPRLRVDATVVLLAVGALTYNLAAFSSGRGEEVVRWTLYVWIVRALRLLTLSRRFGLLAHTLGRLRAPVLTFLGVLFCFLYASAAIGVELFGGKLYEGAPCLRGTDYARIGYEPVNWNSLPSALTLSFALLMVNDYYVFMDATAACSSAWARAYFVLFHLCNVVIVSNLLTSFILEATLRAWADVDARADGGGGASDGKVRDGSTAGARASTPPADGSAAGSAAASDEDEDERAEPFADSARVLDHRTAYLDRMKMKVAADRITLDDGRVYTIQRRDSFTGLAAMEELFEGGR